MKPITDPKKHFRLLLFTSPLGIPAAVWIARFTNPELIAVWAYALLFRKKDPNKITGANPGQR